MTVSARAKGVLAGVAMFLGVALGPAAGQIECVGVEFDRVSPSTDGRIRLYLRNTGNAPVESPRIVEADLDPARPGLKVLWQMMNPGRLQPGATGELMVVLGAPPVRDKALLHVRLGERTVTETVVAFSAPPVRIVSFGHDRPGRQTIIYLWNQSESPWRIGEVEIDGHPVKAARAIGNPLVAGGTAAILCPDISVAAGQFFGAAVTVEHDGRRHTARAVDKGGAPWVIATHSVARLTDGTASVGGINLVSELARSGAPVSANCVCPMHGRHWSTERAGREMARLRRQAEDQGDPFLAMLHVCRFDVPRSFTIYGPLVDVACYNTCLHGAWEGPEPAGYKESPHPFLWRAQAAWQASSPRPFHAVIYGAQAGYVDFPGCALSAGDVRFMAYAAIAAGARGILYRAPLPAADARDINADRVANLNRELQALSPLLTIACPLSGTRTDSPVYTAQSLLAGDKALVAVLLDRRTLAAASGNGVGCRTADPQARADRVALRVALPAGVSPVSVRTLYAALPADRWTFREGELLISATATDTAQAVIADLGGESQRLVPSLFSVRAEIPIPEEWVRLRAELGDAPAFRAADARMREWNRSHALLREAIRVRVAIGAADIVAFGDMPPAQRVAGGPVPRAADLVLAARRTLGEPLEPASLPAGVAGRVTEIMSAYRARLGRDICRSVTPVVIEGLVEEAVAWPFVIPCTGETDAAQAAEALGALPLTDGQRQSLAEYLLRDLDLPVLAVQALRKTARFAGEGADVPCCMDLADAMVRSGHLHAACLALDHGLALSPAPQHVVALRVRLAEIALKRQSTDEAVAHYRVAAACVGTAGADAAALSCVLCLSRKGDHAAVLQSAEQWLKADDLRAVAPEMLSLKWNAALRLKREADASEAARTLLDRYPTNPTCAAVRYWCAAISLAGGDVAVARKHLDALVRTFPDSPLAQKAGMALRDLP